MSASECKDEAVQDGVTLNSAVFALFDNAVQRKNGLKAKNMPLSF